jgi:hypothetical protein
MESPIWTYNSLIIKDEDLRQIRRQIYHSEGPGYFVFRHFFDPPQVDHMQEIWTSPSASRHFKPLVAKNQFRLGSPNFMEEDERGNRSFCNFLWEKPLDELTYEATFYIQSLRNRISGRNPSNELFPILGNSVSYRVVLTRNHEAPVPPHRDLFWEPNPGLSKMQDLTRLQVTLMLSEHGKDYEGQGFALVSNQGKKIVFGVDEPIQAGDLIIWRYPNEHSVMEIRSRDQQLGFLRILYPQEIIHGGRSLGNRLLDSLHINGSRRFLTSHIPVKWKKRIKQALGVNR